MNPRTSPPSIRIVVLLALALGCTSPRKASYLHPAMKKNPPHKVALAPIVDRRPDRSQPIDLEKDVRLVLREELHDKGYSVELCDSLGGAGDLGELDEQALVPLVPGGFHGLLVVCLEDLRSESRIKGIFPAYHFEETLSARLVTSQGAVWEDRYTHRQQGGGLVGASVSRGFAESNGRENAARKLLESLPECGDGR